MAAILLLDDDEYFRRLASSVLKARNHEVVDAARCSDADKLLAVRKFDLIIVDGLLPDSDGIAWIKRFRGIDVVTPVLFVSAFWKNEPRLQDLPISGVCAKPIAPGVLVAKVENALRSAGAAVELPPEALAELAHLRAAFESDLPKLLEGVRQAIAQLRRTPGSAAIRGVAQRRAHQVAGTAGSFGFGEVGDTCARLETLLKGLAISPALRGAWSEIDQLLPVIGEGLLSMCMNCKKIREGAVWVPVDECVAAKTATSFSHAFCPECFKRQIEPESRAVSSVTDGTDPSSVPALRPAWGMP